MTRVSATLRNYRQAPRKVRLLVDLVRGKTVPHALIDLRFSTKRASDPVGKLIQSAVASAKERFGAKESDLRIVEASVNKGVVLKRSRPRARGRAFPIHKHSSHLHIVLETITPAK